MTTVQIKDRSGCPLTLLELEGRLYPEFPVENLKNYRQLPLRDDDVILCGYPKSGTHWLWEVAMMLRRGAAEPIPFKKSLQMLEFNDAQSLTQMPHCRVFNTHVLHENLPEAALTLGLRLILVLRNPKDVAVSYFNHHRRLSKYYKYDGEFHDWLQLYIDGQVDYGSWFDYVKDWEKVLNSDVKNPIHVIMYEDMKEDPVHETKRLAEFLGVEPSAELIEAVTEQCHFSRMAESKKPFQDHAEIMFRKGIVGDWKTKFTVADNEIFDAVFAEKMKDSKLSFRFTL